MINKRLISYMGNAKTYMYKQVFVQWLALLSQIILIFILGNLINTLYVDKIIEKNVLFISIGIILVLMLFKAGMRILSSKYSYLSSEHIKLKLREEIYEKLMRLHIHYPKHISTSSLTQLCVEGVDQLEIYFGKYLPQFFYSMLAPITLFAILMFVEWKASLVLLICVPLIPMSIVAVQKFAKKLLGKYWGMYGNLGERFLDNIRGLSTLKNYQSDDLQHEKMNEEAENFRKITMKVLIMQLNSISVMDIVAFGGAAIGIILTLLSYRAGNISVKDAFIMIMLSAEFFIPLRLLGSFFHIAMNGNAAASKIFNFLDVEENKKEYDAFHIENEVLRVENVSYSYDKEKTVLKNISLDLKGVGSYGIVGESGSGKSTLAALLSGRLPEYEGNIFWDNREISTISHTDMMKEISIVDHQAFLFKGTIRSNLLFANPNASEEEMLKALEKVRLLDFIKEQDGLDTLILEKASNLSGGQAQRLSLARALLRDSSVYIFDESTSNIDVESENAIMEVIHALSKEKIVIMITHRLANVENFDHIFVFRDGELKEEGNHTVLMQKNALYTQMVDTQRKIEMVIQGGVQNA